MITHYQRIANLLNEAGATPEMVLYNRMLSIFRENGEEVSLSEDQFFEETPRTIQLWQISKGMLFLMRTFRKQNVCMACYEDSPGVAELLRPFGGVKEKPRFEPRKRTAIDGKIWWVPFDTKRGIYSRSTLHWRYKSRKECAANILAVAKYLIDSEYNN